jgi:iron-sulfur cluster assembly accessory protein
MLRESALRAAERKVSTMSDSQIAPNQVILTERAAKRIKRIVSKEEPGTVLRISVAGGGCSGFQYEYNLVQEEPASDDLVLTRDEATVYIDSLSLEFLGGSEIDFVDDLIGQSFQIRNPNAVASCGCGTSFAV